MCQELQGITPIGISMATLGIFPVRVAAESRGDISDFLYLRELG